MVGTVVDKPLFASLTCGFYSDGSGRNRRVEPCMGGTSHAVTRDAAADGDLLITRSVLAVGGEEAPIFFRKIGLLTMVCTTFCLGTLRQRHSLRMLPLSTGFVGL